MVAVIVNSSYDQTCLNPRGNGRIAVFFVGFFSPSGKIKSQKRGRMRRLVNCGILSRSGSGGTDPSRVSVCEVSDEASDEEPTQPRQVDISSEEEGGELPDTIATEPREPRRCSHFTALTLLWSPPSGRGSAASAPCQGGGGVFKWSRDGFPRGVGWGGALAGFQIKPARV